MKKVWFSLITVILVLTVIAIFFEAGLRIKGLFDKNRGLKNSMGRIDKKYCHGFKPNSKFRLVASKNDEYNVAVKINNYGFRGKDISKEKEPGVMRIMAIGDSFTFGVGARENETIPFLLEQYLLAEGRRVEVINSGFGHYSPLLHYLKVRDEYMEFKPDLVLYFFDFSDLADDWRGERQLVYDKAGRILRCDASYLDGKKDWWKTFRMKSKLCGYIHRKVIRLIEKIRILGFKNYVKAKIEGKRAKALIIQKKKKEKTVNFIEYDGYLMIRGRDNLPLIKKHFKRNEKYLDLIKARLAEEGIPMVLVIYPYGIHVGPDHWGKGRGFWGFENKIYDDYYAFDMLEDYARGNKIQCINVLSSFLKNKEKPLFFDIDGHFTPLANQITAGHIVNDRGFQRILDTVLSKPQ